MIGLIAVCSDNFKFISVVSMTLVEPVLDNEYYLSVLLVVVPKHNH